MLNPALFQVGDFSNSSPGGSIRATIPPFRMRLRGWGVLHLDPPGAALDAAWMKLNSHRDSPVPSNRLSRFPAARQPACF